MKRFPIGSLLFWFWQPHTLSKTLSEIRSRVSHPAFRRFRSDCFTLPLAKYDLNSFFIICQMPVVMAEGLKPLTIR
jgi:hypothetical protein